MQRAYNKPYSYENLSRVAFPLGGIGAGMICLEGTGALSHFSLHNKPEVFREPMVFSALHIRGEQSVSKVLEGPVPSWKIFGRPSSGNGAAGTSYGLPRFAASTFSTRFPFGTVSLEHQRIPLQVDITGWSPFIPGDADNSSLPVAALEYRFRNTSGTLVDAIYSFNAVNFMTQPKTGAVLATQQGFILSGTRTDGPHEISGSFCATVDDPAVQVNCAWFRGSWYDPLTICWKNIQNGTIVSGAPVIDGSPSPGASLFVPFRLAAGEEKVVRLMFSWYVPQSGVRTGTPPADKDVTVDNSPPPETYRPWYTGRFTDISAVATYWRDHYAKLKHETEKFTECFYDTTLPDEVVEAVAANLTIFKSPTVLRQIDGRLWGWEGCRDSSGCCEGSCTHVWNYAQSMPHLFPALERSLRSTEMMESQNEQGHQNFRAALPIRPTTHNFHAAADGQLGGIVKVYRDWRISGDTQWMQSLWPQAKASLNYCIETWDPDHKGVLVEPHHNTYDIEFWGPDGMCTSFYLGALRAAVAMGTALGEDMSAYQALLEKGSHYLETELFNGEYFYQKVEWEGLRAGNPTLSPSARTNYSPEALLLLAQEGPKYQYGTGCLSDGILGVWLATVCGVDVTFVDEGKVRQHLHSVYKYNLKHDLSEHANPQRPSYAVNNEGGLLLCTWPHGGEPSLPFVYSNEVWTGIEYQVASHLIMLGMVEQGLEVVRVCRARYDGRVRNPFNEYECGHWYARAMASYALIFSLSGACYDAVEKILYIKPAVSGDFRSFIAVESGYGTVGVQDGKPFLDVKHGHITVDKVVYQP